MMKLSEKVFASLAILGYIMSWLGKSGEVFIMLSLLALAAMYFYFGFALFNNIPFRSIFKAATYRDLKGSAIIRSILSGAAIAIALMGILFFTFHWGNYFYILLFGSVATLAVVALYLVSYRGTKNALALRILQRAVPVLIVACVCLVLYIQSCPYPEAHAG